MYFDYTPACNVTSRKSSMPKMGRKDLHYRYLQQHVHISMNQYMRSLHYSITAYTNCQSDKCCSDIDYQYYCHLESFSLEFFKLFIV